jgi:hypothetical protein
MTSIYTPSNAWELHTSNIMVNGCKMYRFWSRAATITPLKQVVAMVHTANFDTYLELYNNNCSSITSNDDACENYRSSINWTAGYTGYVYLKVKVGEQAEVHIVWLTGIAAPADPVSAAPITTTI